MNIQPTAKTPGVNIGEHDGTYTVQIKGRCIPEDAIGFYKPIMEHLDKYATHPLSKTQLDFALEYFNTSTSKCLVKLFKKIEAIDSTEKVVNWYFDQHDYDIKEAGEDFDDIIEIPFNLVPIAEEDDDE